MTQILIIIHAALGGISLLAGLSAIFAVKGSTRHKFTGKIFFYCMSASVVISIIVALIPGHENYFLLVIGVFSLYLIVTGKRIYAFGTYIDQKAKTIDKVLTYIMILFGVIMISWGIYLVVTVGYIGFVQILFGLIGMSLAFSDLRFFKKWYTNRNELIQIHISKMVGGYIAAWTAFLVVNNALPGILSWLLPTAIGTFYIISQRKKYNYVK